MTYASKAGNKSAKASTPSQFEPKIQPKGDGGDLARRLFVAAGEGEERDVVLDQLNQLKTKFKEDITFWGRFRDNKVTDEQLKAIGFSGSLEKILSQGRKEGKLQHLANLMRNYETMYKSEPRRVTAVLSTMRNLSGAELATYEKELRSGYPSIFENTIVTWKSKKDTTVLGGFTLQLGDVYIDNTTRTKLKQVEQDFLSRIDSFHQANLDYVLQNRS